MQYTNEQLIAAVKENASHIKYADGSGKETMEISLSSYNAILAILEERKVEEVPKSENEWVDIFLKKAEYLSFNVGAGELWNRSTFKEKIIDVLIDTAALVQKDAFAEINALQEENEALRQWKEEQIAVTPDMQAIGKALGVGLGQSIHDKILPVVLAYKSENEKKDALLKEMALVLHTVNESSMLTLFEYGKIKSVLTQYNELHKSR